MAVITRTKCRVLDSVNVKYVFVRGLSPEGTIKNLSKLFKRMAEFKRLGTSLKITDAKPRRIHCQEKNSSDIAASSRQTGFKTRGVRREQNATK